jgi:hypothetical protein
LAELIEELKLPIGVSRLSQILTSWRYSLKKKDTPSDHAETRRCDKKNVRNGRKTNERVNDYVPDVRFERTNVVASIRLNGQQS